MKHFLFSLSLLISYSVFSQIIVGSEEYKERKRTNTLAGFEIIPGPGSSSTFRPKPKKAGDDVVHNKSTSCDCYIDPDGTYTEMVPVECDDGFSNEIPIPFGFCFYGQVYNSIFINNNGNITFEQPLATFSANAFPDTANATKIIAPFWGDVDLCGTGNIFYKITPTAVYVNWEAVGYYPSEVDLVNTFQLIITNGADPVVTDGNIAFCYKDMQWTTGGASEGVNGFGGIPATAGANKGDSTTFFQVARFDHPGIDFDGALGNPDGISWLDNKSFYFNICNSDNVPPIPEGLSACDTFTLCALNDTADISIQFLSPEMDQITTITYSNTSGLDITEVNNVPGNSTELILRIVAQPGTLGYHTVTVTATDDFVPAGLTTISFTVFIDTIAGAGLNPVITPLRGCDSIVVSVLNGPYDTYLWDNFGVYDTTEVNTSGIFGVTVSRNGCYKRTEHFLQVAEPVDFDFDGGFSLCDGVSSTLITLLDSVEYSTITWGLANPARDSLFSNDLTVGTYTVSVMDTAGLCQGDTTFTISTVLPLVLQQDTVLCMDSLVFMTNHGGNSEGLWTFFNSAGTPVFSDTTILNPTVNFPLDGVYNLVYTDRFCPLTDTVVVSQASPILFDFHGILSLCQNDLTTSVYLADSMEYSAITWNFPDPAIDSMFINEVGPGTYNLTVTEILGFCSKDTTFTVVESVPVILQSDTVLCVDTILFVHNTGGSGQGVWSFYSSVSTPDFVDSLELNSVVIFPVQGTYNLVYTDANCNYADTITIRVVTPPQFNFSSDFIICNGVPKDLFVADSLMASHITWGLSNPAQDSIYRNILAAGTYHVIVDDTTGFCPIDTSFTIVEYTPVILIPDVIACSNYINLSGNTGGSGSGSWSCLSCPGSPQFTSGNNLNQLVGFFVDGNYTLVYNDNFCAYTDTFHVGKSSSVYFGLNSDFFVCPGNLESLAISDSISKGHMSWGIANPARDTLYSGNFTAGTYNATILNALGLCPKDTTFTISSLTNIVLEQDLLICNSGNHQFISNLGGSGAGAWTFHSTSATNPQFSSQTALNPDVSFSSTGIYSLIFTDAVCSNVKDSVIVTVGVIPQFKLITDGFYCPETTEALSVNPANLASIVWDPTLPQLNNDFSVNLTAGTYNASIVSSLGCQKDTTFTLVTQPIINLFDYTDQCSQQLVMNQNGVAPAGSWSFISGPGTVSFTSQTAVNTTMNVSAYGVYTVRYYEPKCNDGDTITVEFIPDPVVTILDDALCQGQPFELVAATNVNPANLSWSTGASGISIPVSTKGTYYVTATNFCGISPEDSAFIDIRLCEMSFPNIFTPGADLLNPLFMILHTTDAFPDFQCQIFNRWGNLVYEYFDANGGWDGKALNGEDAAPGVYFYKVVTTSFVGDHHEFQGSIQLVR